MADCIPDFFTTCPEVVEEAVVDTVEAVDEVEEVVEEVEEVEMMEEEGEMMMDEDKKDTMMEAQIAFLLSAGVSAAMSGLDLFAWKW